jgi:hypothetical protein
MRGDSMSTFTPQRADRDILTAIERTTVRMVPNHVTSKERLKEKGEAIISVIANGGFGGGGRRIATIAKNLVLFISSCDIPAIRIQVVQYQIDFPTSCFAYKFC